MKDFLYTMLAGTAFFGFCTYAYSKVETSKAAELKETLAVRDARIQELERELRHTEIDYIRHKVALFMTNPEETEIVNKAVKRVWWAYTIEKNEAGITYKPVEKKDKKKWIQSW